jgi:hypothetical protein
MNLEHLTLYLFSILAPISGFDVLYSHIYRFKLAQRPESWREKLKHIF